MNREILFKAKRVDNGEWVYGWYAPAYVSDETIDFVIYTDKIGSPYCMGKFNAGLPAQFEVLPETVSQDTGLLDKHCNRIFEGDIIFASGSYMLTVLWNNEEAKFEAVFIGSKSGHEDDDNDDWASAEDFESYEIIGNKWEAL